ncbi:hypothetical protein ASG71_09980 [Arthrobacter sp. Soil763]|nr:hypothetical protein ASG71_09980 [Arthrobacter sp. Soil763]
MATKSVGGGSGAVASSSHAACARFRGTDPLITGLTRRNLAKAVGFADTAGGIPQARWMRAMTFERLIRQESFAGKIATTAVGYLGLDRPAEVVTVNAHVNVSTTAKLLADAHERAVLSGAATLVYDLSVPFVGFEGSRATDVKPDFAVVARKAKGDGSGTWLIVGDAKDYERLRSRIEDSRMLKGFLQVAVGAESCRGWSQLPAEMDVHTHGVLAVPRNSFLQPEAVVENLHDYREEVLLRIAERRAEALATDRDESTPLPEFVSHLKATFDPATCTTCTLFSFCRDELRRSEDPADLLIELGISRDLRTQAMGLVDGSSEVGRVPATVAANIDATLHGVAQPTGQLRVDQVGLPGTVNVVMAKSDAAALGVHGLAIQRVTPDGRGEWQSYVYSDPQSPETRRQVMRTLGRALNLAMREQRIANPASPGAIYIVVPDRATADVLVSVADNLAGVELSRLRWQRDKDMGRPALTFDGEPAEMPAAISETDRTAISFLLEEDRARAFSLRCPIIDVRAVLARHFVAGGPSANSGRLDYLVGWAEAVSRGALDQRAYADEIEESIHTPGARLANAHSDAIHVSLTGTRVRSAGSGPADSPSYHDLVWDELAYKCDVLDRTLDVLEALPVSKLRETYRTVESAAQEVWRRRLSLHASDLVRFGRTYRFWRNSQVRMIESDQRCTAQLLALSNPQSAHDLATSAGTREVAFATVVSTDPIVLDVDSRRIVEGSRVVMVVHNDEACVEAAITSVDVAPKSAFKIDGMSIGPLHRAGVADEAAPKTHLVWSPQVVPPLSAGERLIVADFEWFSNNQGNRHLHVAKPGLDAQSAPRPDCESGSHDEAPQIHQWCCRSHESREGEWSDVIADRRARGQLNPQVWPPVRDGDAFEVIPSGAPVGNPYSEPSEMVPADLTIDDLE